MLGESREKEKEGGREGGHNNKKKRTLSLLSVSKICYKDKFVGQLIAIRVGTTYTYSV